MIKIRYAFESDINQIVGLCEEHARYEGVAFDSNNKVSMLSKHIFNPKSGIKCLVVEKEGRAVGYATFFKQFSTWDADNYLYLDCLYLKDELRGMGIGAKLMDEVKAYAMRIDCKIIEWQTPNFNTGAIAFYNKVGAKSNSKERFIWNID